MRHPTAAELTEWKRASLVQALGIVILGVEGDALRGTMPVDARTHQIHGLLHGGASVALAETLGSLGALLSVDANAYRCVGIEVNANHVRGVREGVVVGEARALHLGRTSHVWQIEIRNAEGKLACVSRLTVAVLPA